VNVPSSGVGGLLGSEEEQCFDIELPSQKVEQAVIGGGTTADYFTDSALKDAIELNIEVTSFGAPSTIDEIQENYALVDNTLLEVELR